ncbi:MAG: acetyl-CoA synthetase [Proteobacteria bacterium]|nr:acetyl-CoA synthetase [Pseudomonadota bacterium]
MAETTSQQLQAIFDARSVAVIGASSVPFKWGAQTLNRLLNFGFQGTVYPINPKDAEIQGIRAYPSVLDVPGDIDLAIITVKADMVPGAMKECAEKGIPGAIIISADFAETGERGRAVQEETVEIARHGGIRFVGPNCFGIFNSANGLNTLPTAPAKGDIGFISQSGSLVHMVARTASAKGYGISKLVSAGNQASLDVADYLEFLGEDPETKAIVVYLEGFKDGRKLFEVAKGMAGKKPVVVYKAGRHPDSDRVSMSHTANMTGEDRIFDAMCRQVGFIRADTLHGAMDMAAVLTRQPLPRGNRIGIQGTGGQCMILTDSCLSHGMKVPELNDEESAQIISGIDFPPHAPTPRNPVDMAGAHTALMDATVINNMARLDTIDAIISYRPITFHFHSDDSPEQREEMDRKVGDLISQAPLKYGKPLILIGFDRALENELFQNSEILNRAIESAGILSFHTLEDAADAMSALVKYAAIKARFSK